MIQFFPVALMIFSGFMLSMWFSAMLLGCSYWDSVGAFTAHHYFMFPKSLPILFSLKEKPPDPDHLFLTNVAPKIGQHDDNTSIIFPCINLVEHASHVRPYEMVLYLTTLTLTVI